MTRGADATGPRRAAPRESLTPGEARRAAIAAQGLAVPRPAGPVNLGHVRRMLDRVGVIQIDSVNVVARAHDLVLWSRLGDHPRDLLPRLHAAGGAVELWAHEASIAPPALYPLLRWRMARPHHWGGLARLGRERPELLDEVEAAARERGPITAADLGRSGRRGPWWGWDHAKQALEVLFWHGRLAARRRADFARLYDVPERIVPLEALTAPVPDAEAAHRELLVLAGRALGVATAGDLVDYHRLSRREAVPRLAEVVEDGRLLPVRVRGWDEVAYLHPDARVPRRTGAAALLAPFDPLVWCRPRVERLWGIRFRLEIYVPAERRVHGYYVLPFLLGERLTARVDVKADRRDGVLRVRAADLDDGEAGDVAVALAAELRAMAAWLGLGEVRVEPRGDLAAVLAAALA